MPRLASLIAVVALLTSCSAGGAAPGSPTPPPRTITTKPATATPTAPRTGPLTTGPNVRPGEKPPERSADSLKHTIPGALAFAEYYFKAFDWTVATNDGYAVQEISSPKCDACRQVMTSVAILKAKRRVLMGGRLTFESSMIVFKRFDIEADYVVQIRTKQDAETIYDEVGNVVSRHPSETDDSLVFVLWSTGAWRVREVTHA